MFQRVSVAMLLAALVAAPRIADAQRTVPGRSGQRAPARTPAAAPPVAPTGPASPVERPRDGGVDPAIASVRRQLIEDARRFSVSGNHEQAVAAFLQAARTAGGMNPSVRRAIAQEFRALARWRDMLNNARLCVREVEEVRGQLQERQRILRDCRAMQNEAVQHVGRVVFVLPDAAPADTRITLSEHFDRNRWTDAAAVSPGAATLTVRAAGYRTEERQLTMEEGQIVEERIELVPEAPVAPPPPPVAPRLEVQRRPEPPPRRPQQSPALAPWILLASGALVGAAGAVTAVVLRGGAVDELRDIQARARAGGADCALNCDQLRAGFDAEALGPRETVDAMNIVLGASIGVATTAVVGGLLWYFASRPAGAAPTGPAIALGIGPQGPSLTIGGAF